MDAAAFVRVEALLRRAVLRFAPGAEPPAASSLEEGARPWFADTETFLDAVAAMVGGHTLPAAGFGGGLSALESSGQLLAPGLPIPVASEPRQGPEADYWREGDAVWRSVAGRSERVLSLGAAAAAPGPAIDLLWFGDGERCVLAGGNLTIDDRFSRLRVAADPARLERELTRRLRVDPAAISGLPTRSSSSGPARIEVRRAAGLLPKGIWDDPAAVLAAREGVERADLEGERLRLRLVGGEAVELVVTPRPGGWRAERRCGDWPYLTMELVAEVADVTYAVDLDPRIDPLQPGVRTRLAFDLGSDLVMLGR